MMLGVLRDVRKRGVHRIGTVVFAVIA